MLNRLLILLLLAGCGPQVSISHSKLEKYSAVTQAEEEQLVREAVLLRTGSVDVISLGSSSYNVSKYSSQQALGFISARPKGSQTNVRCKGTLNGGEIILNSIMQI